VEYRWQGLGHRLHFSFEKVEKVTGVNSRLDDKTHFLMWDFDNIPLPMVLASLKDVQEMFQLPPISILSTGKPDGYHAYCFQGCNFRFARTIIAATANVDLKYLALGLMRGYFTLRFTDVEGRQFEPVGELPSKVSSTCKFNDINCFVNYTKRVK